MIRHARGTRLFWSSLLLSGLLFLSACNGQGTNGASPASARSSSASAEASTSASAASSAAMHANRAASAGANAAEEDISLTDAEQKDPLFFSEPLLGIKLHMPSSWAPYRSHIGQMNEGNPSDASSPVFQTVAFTYQPQSAIDRYNEILAREDLPEDELQSQVVKDVYPKIKVLFALWAIRSEAIGDEGILAQNTGFAHNEVLQRGEQFAQVYSYNDVDVSNLSDEEAAIYKKMMADLPTLRASFRLATPVNTTLQNAWHFKTTDLDGKDADQSLFSTAQYTVVNLWATWCKPCRQEIPELEKLHTALQAKNMQVIGIAYDVEQNKPEDTLDLAKEILSKSGAHYENYMVSADLHQILDRALTAYPMSYLVDAKGVVVGEPHIGAGTLEDYQKWMDTCLQGK